MRIVGTFNYQKDTYTTAHSSSDVEVEISMNELAGQNLGGYQLDEEIGRGSMGVVYRGKQIALEREVAIKVLPHLLARDSSYVARFIREAQIIAGLNHPNIVQIYDAGQQNKLLYFVMEYVQGPTLASLLRIDGSLPQYLAVEYVMQIADALDTAYKERNVIHRDIKPENLMLNRWGKVKVMDFGLARAPGHQRITVAKTLVGSIYYASPEQVWGHSLDNRSDIYALGVVLYEIVTGRRPFTGRSMPELTQAIVRGILQPPSAINPEITPQLEHIILTALARDREQRYEHASIMAQQLRELNLQPPPQMGHLSESGPMTPTRIARDRTVIQPPKRPQTQRPHYLDLDIDLEQTQPPPSEENTPASPAFPHAQHLPIQEAQIANLPTNPLGPMSYFYQHPSVREVREGEFQEIEPDPHSPEAKRSFWLHLQKLFKMPPR